MLSNLVLQIRACQKREYTKNGIIFLFSDKPLVYGNYVFPFTLSNNLCYSLLAISLATWIPLAEAWDREWVIPLPSPIM